jgi:ATP-dependent Lon protease
MAPRERRHVELYRLETQVTWDIGKLTTSGLGSNTAAKETLKVDYDYFKANASAVTASAKPGDHEVPGELFAKFQENPRFAMSSITLTSTSIRMLEPVVYFNVVRPCGRIP